VGYHFCVEIVDALKALFVMPTPPAITVRRVVHDRVFREPMDAGFNEMINLGCGFERVKC